MCIVDMFERQQEKGNETLEKIKRNSEKFKKQPLLEEIYSW